MQHFRLLFTVTFALLLVSPAALDAQEQTPLPFSVSLGGQAAQVKGKPGEAAFATVEKPVAANAPLEVGAKGDMIIVNVVAADDKGTPAAGAAPAVLLIQNGNKTTLDKTMDGQKLAAGSYLMSVVAEGRTASITFKVQ